MNIKIIRFYNNGGVVCKLDKKRWEKFVEGVKKNQRNQQK
jgi:hypothetical protein